MTASVSGFWYLHGHTGPNVNMITFVFSLPEYLLLLRVFLFKCFYCSMDSTWKNGFYQGSRHYARSHPALRTGWCSAAPRSVAGLVVGAATRGRRALGLEVTAWTLQTPAGCTIALSNFSYLTLRMRTVTMRIMRAPPLRMRLTPSRARSGPGAPHP